MRARMGLYMAGLMTAPTVAIELVLMRSMFPKKALNAAILAASAIALVGFWALIRDRRRSATASSSSR